MVEEQLEEWETAGAIMEEEDNGGTIMEREDNGGAIMELGYYIFLFL